MLAIVFLGLTQLTSILQTPQDVLIPVQGLGKAGITVTVSRGGSPGLFELQMKTGTGVQLTLPSAWTLREVRGMDLKGISSKAPTRFGRTWKITEHGIASFWMSGKARSLQLRNTGSGTLAVTVRQIFVREGRLDEQEYLVTNKPLQVW